MAESTTNRNGGGEGEFMCERGKPKKDRSQHESCYNTEFTIREKQERFREKVTLTGSE